MKNLKYILFAAALAFAAACVEKEAAVPAEPELEVETETLTITVADLETRTYIANNGKVAWNSADYLYVFDDSEDQITEVDGTKVYNATNRHVFTQTDVKGTFECKTWPAGRTPKYVLFNRLSTDAEKADEYNPANLRIIYGHDEHGDNIVAVLPNKQHVGNENSFGGSSNMSAGKVETVDGNYFVRLQNVCGLVKFTLEEKAAKVTFRGRGSEIIAGGRVRICFNQNEDGSPSWKKVGSDGSTIITMTANDNIWSATNEFYLCVLPQTLKNGFVMEVETADGKTYTKTGTKPLTITRNKVVNIGHLSEATADVDNEGEIPANALVLELPMTADALPAGFPTTYADSKVGPDSYSFTIGGTPYSFEFNADGRSDAKPNGVNQNAETTKNGYYFETKTIDDVDYYQYSLGSTYGYVKFPAISGKRLYKVSVYVANGTRSGESSAPKWCTIREVLFTEKVNAPGGNAPTMTSDIDGSDAVLISAENPNDVDGWLGPKYTWTFGNGTKANTPYYFLSRNGSVKLAKLKLIYVPAE